MHGSILLLLKQWPQLVDKRREPKGKGERERYTQLNTELQRIASRDKKALGEHCKAIEENNRMGNSRDLYKKTGDTKGIFHARTGVIKDKNSKDLTEAEEIKKMWQEYTEELFKRDLNDVGYYSGVVTRLGYEVKWALGSITMNKSSGGNGIPAELFQILKDDAVKVLHSICQQIWKTQQWPQDGKRSVFILIPK